jgi:hypothetical protein
VWGDLWALGAKTRTVRRIRLGKGGIDPGDGGVRSRDAQAAAGRKRNKVVDINVHPQFGVLGTTERGRVTPERRTKGGRHVKVKIDDVLDRMGINEMEDPEDAEDAEFLKGGRK